MNDSIDDCGGCNREGVDCDSLIGILSGTREEFECWHALGDYFGDRGEGGMNKPREGCSGCGRQRDGLKFAFSTGCETLLDELRPLGMDCWRPAGVVFVYDEKKEDWK